jgi:hypothetical protein
MTMMMIMMIGGSNVENWRKWGMGWRVWMK